MKYRTNEQISPLEEYL